MYFSIIIPVYNRPDEMEELLSSLEKQDFSALFEVVVIEDGSTLKSDDVILRYSQKLTISYYNKENSGPGDSRNFGMKNAKGDYFLIFDSDCIIPKDYLKTVEQALQLQYVDFFGGPDKALDSFSDIQKAINFSMTSFITTGGVRGGTEKVGKFQPRSFNMGISKEAFRASGGFGNIHPGEDPDLTIRLWDLGFKSRLIPEAYVYHKRRIDWDKFALQTMKFGKARPILDLWHANYRKWTYFFPSIFIIGFYFSLFLLLFVEDFLFKLYCIYFLMIFLLSSVQNRNIAIGFLSIFATWIQFKNYGFGFVNSFIKINILKQKPQEAFPELFFKK
ncbi:MAG: glycosyltransferase [Flavobacterium sp.]|nr:glycosyltransferase [Flavobacterium sp.]